MVVLLGQIGRQLVPFFVGNVGGQFQDRFPDRFVFLLAGGPWLLPRVLRILPNQRVNHLSR
jgi:hypothetical protein